MTTENNKKQTNKKSCFVIGPIGDEGSNIRKDANALLEHIIAPAVIALGYTPPVRSDAIDLELKRDSGDTQQFATADILANLKDIQLSVGRFEHLPISYALKTVPLPDLFGRSKVIEKDGTQ
jgi:hypothetical protein